MAGTFGHMPFHDRNPAHHSLLEAFPTSESFQPTFSYVLPKWGFPGHCRVNLIYSHEKPAALQHEQGCITRIFVDGAKAVSKSSCRIRFCSYLHSEA